MFYDIIIIGGGISGVNAMYQLNIAAPELKILLLERSSSMGGRIYTYKDKHMEVPAGAGRFSDTQPCLMKLLSDLRLSSKMVPIGNSALYSPADNTGSVQNSIMDAPFIKNGMFFSNRLIDSLMDSYLGTQNIPSAGLVARVIMASKLESKKKLQNTSFLKYAKEVLVQDELVQYIEDTFGYYSELVMMNAYDAIHLMGVLSPTNKYYALKGSGGLSQIIDKMIDKINKSSNCTIMMKKEVNKIVYLKGEMGGTGFEVHIEGKDKWYGGRKIICALPTQALQKISIFRPVMNLLKSVKCGALCRIYSKFDAGPDGKVWFANLPKLTTNNEVRMIIPMDVKKGTIMISYSDNKFADFWNDIYQKQGISGVNKTLQEKLKEVLGYKIPMPKHTKVFYWGCGVGYWGIGADSERVSKEIQKPFATMDLYVCGEHFSEKNQQWIEGALETSNQVVDRILGKKQNMWL